MDTKPRRARQQVEKVATGPAAAVASTVRNAPIFGGGRVCKPATLSEVTFGNVSTLSGVLGELFAPAVPALNTFMTSQNACGGLSGHKIKIVIKDDQGDPSTAVTRAQELIQKDRILAFVGNIQVLTIHAIVPTIKQAGIPIIGGDLTSSAWFENPLIFPQAASIQSFAVGYLTAIKNHFKKTVVGNLWCIEVPASCGAINVALKDLAPKFGIRIAAAPQVSLTQPSFVQECLQMKNAGVEAAVISTDAASAVRFARSCPQVGFFPETLIHQIGIGSEKQFLGNPWLGGTYIPLNTFAHMANRTPAERYYQASVRKFNPGFDTGGAASTAWTAGALLVAAAANLPAENPTTQDLLDTLYEFRGQDFTRLGGLTATSLTYERDGVPRIPYCRYERHLEREEQRVGELLLHADLLGPPGAHGSAVEVAAEVMSTRSDWWPRSVLWQKPIISGGRVMGWMEHVTDAASAMPGMATQAQFDKLHTASRGPLEALFHSCSTTPPRCAGHAIRTLSQRLARVVPALSTALES